MNVNGSDENIITQVRALGAAAACANGNEAGRGRVARRRAASICLNLKFLSSERVGVRQRSAKEPSQLFSSLILSERCNHKCWGSGHRDPGDMD